MNIQPVNNHETFTCICIKCEKVLKGKELKFADLDGKAFVDYYCENCKNEVSS